MDETPTQLPARDPELEAFELSLRESGEWRARLEQLARIVAREELPS